MAPRTQAHQQSSMLRAGASDSEDEIVTSEGNQHNLTPNGHQAAHTNSKMAKPKVTARRVSVGPKKTAVKRKPAQREALKDRTNVPDGNETEEVEQFEDDENAKPKAKKAKRDEKPKAVRKKAPARAASEEPRALPAAKRAKATKRAPSAEPLHVIPETQPDLDAMEDISQSIEVPEDDNMSIDQGPTPKPVQKFVQRQRSTSVQPLQPRPSARAGSAQPPAYMPPPRERSASASGTERERRGGDPELRRKLNDTTKKYESLSMKYQGLQEVGQNGAQSNFEKLKRASDAKAKDANDLIASLKRELADTRRSNSSSSSETQTLQKQIASLTSANEKLTSANEKITAEHATCKSQLQVSQNEVKSLEAKLAASRQEAKAPGSAAKMNGVIRGVVATGTEAQREAKMKEDLYSDLTGLIINRVKRKEAEDEYDCIQTGRNGTLHFHLSIANDSALSNPKTPTGLSYEEAEFAYEPLLDESRDRELLDLLPDYLTEEICFPRNHAQKFYSRVVESMTKKIVIEE